MKWFQHLAQPLALFLFGETKKSRPEIASEHSDNCPIHASAFEPSGGGRITMTWQAVLLVCSLSALSMGPLRAQFTPTLYRALNLNGPATTIDGNSWQSGIGAANFNYTTTGSAFQNQSVTLNPATDANRATMIRSSVWGEQLTLNVTSVPSGAYDVYIYTWEDNASSNFSGSLEGVQIVASYVSGNAGSWSKLGPFRVAISDGAINVAIAGGAANISGLEIWTAPGAPPVVSSKLTNQLAVAGQSFTYVIPNTAFTDPDAGTTLTYAATLANGGALPSWLTFNATTRTFSGTPSTANAAAVNVKVTASDGTGGSVSDIFLLTVNTGIYNPYRLINLNGPSLSIDGTSWEAGTSAANLSITNGNTLNMQTSPLTPATDANRASMIRSAVWGNVNLGVSAMPAGNYAIWVYVWEDNWPITFSFTLEGTAAVTNYNSGAAGTWNKLGPFLRTVSDGTLNLAVNGPEAILSGIEIYRVNTAPVVATPIPDQTATAGQPVSYAFPANTFSDADAGTTFTYAATLSNGNPLPSWLTFTSGTRTFSGTPAAGDVGVVDVRVTASDGASGAVFDAFQLTVNTPPFTATFYRALNMNGPAITIDGKSWQASSGASNFTQTGGNMFENPALSLVPSTDANRSTMLRSAIWGNPLNLNVTSVPNGNYDVYLYTVADVDPISFSGSLEGTQIISAFASSGVGSWKKLGPFRTAISDGAINLVLGSGSAVVSGIEIWTAPNPPVVSNPLADQVITAGQNYSYIVPSNAFTDPDAGTTLTYAASLADGSALPSWLSFNVSTRTFSGTPLAANAGALNVMVTASDGTGGSASDIFLLTINTDVYNLYRAVNLNGSSLSIDGHNWEASSGAANLSITNNNTLNVQTALISPPTDANRATMIRSGVWGSLNVGMSSMPAGNYAIWVYVWEDNWPITFSFTLEGTAAVTNYNSGAGGTWNKLGPFLRTVSDGTLNLAVNGPEAILSGIEVYTVGGTVAVTDVSISPSTLSLSTGQTAQLTKTITPANATNQNATWSSSNTAVATVNSTTGLVTAVANGTATVTVTTADGGKQKTATVNVSGIAVTGLSVSPTAVNIPAGNTLKLSKTIQPSNATNQNVNWTSANTAIATVDANGVVTALAPGFTTITAATVSGTFSKTATINVLNAGADFVTNGEFDAGTANWQLDDYTSPATASISKVTNAAMSGTNALRVDVTNTANSDWTLQLVQNMGRKIEVGKTYRITFKAKAESNRQVILSIFGTSVYNYVLQTFDLTATSQQFSLDYTCNQANATSETAFQFKFYLAFGVINDVWLDDITMTDITPPVAATGVDVTLATASATVGQTLQLTTTLTPANATNKTVVWSSSNPAVASVNSNTGLVTAISQGTTTITATTMSGGFTDFATLTIGGVSSIPVTGINISATSLGLQPGQITQITPDIIPSNATNKAISWISSNPAVASVDVNGNIMGVSAGAAIITATTDDGHFNDQLTVTVTFPVGAIADNLEIAALKDFYFSLDGPNWVGTNWPSTEQAWAAITSVGQTQSWTGISLTNGDVTELVLIGKKLRGNIPQSIGKLSRLEGLDISGDSNVNWHDIGGLHNLNQLLNLKFLYAKDVHIGTIPNFGLLQQLTALDISTNTPPASASGFPVWVGDLPHLTSLRLNNLNLIGELPGWLGETSPLMNLSIGGNHFTGTLPESLHGVQSITASKNELSGNLPAWLFTSAVVSLLLDNNNFSGPLPTLSSPNRVVFCYIRNNQLSGELPSGNNWTDFNWLDLSGNQIVGQVPASIVTMFPGTLVLSNNKMTGFASNFWAQYTGGTIQVDNNYMTLQSLLPIANVSGNSSITYSPQRVVPNPAIINVTVNTALTISGGYDATTWYKWQGNAWTSTATGTVLSIASAQFEHSGKYKRESVTTTPILLTVVSDDISVSVTQPVDNSSVDRRYNGLITSVRWRTDKVHESTVDGFNGMQLYRYDDKYQISDARFAENIIGSAYSVTAKYRLMDMAYDPNGNIRKLQRFDDRGVRLHNFTYHYEDEGSSPKYNNKLKKVEGYVNAYTYNLIGQMTGEDKEAIGEDQYVEYDVTGKVTKVYDNAAKGDNDLKIENLYDDRGFRLAKINHITQRTTWYIRDASGNVISVYETEGLPGGESVPIEWSTLANIQEGAGGNYTLTSGATAGEGRSFTRLGPYEDGFLEYTVEDLQMGKELGMVKVSNSEYLGIRFNDAANTIDLRSNETTWITSPYIIGDVLRVERVGANLHITKNNTRLLTFYAGGSNSLEIFIKLNETNAKFSGLKFKITKGLNQTEVPLYGSGKLGTFYPLQDSSINYEITDHLGNVRALLRENVNTYTSTMEDNGELDESNPRTAENIYFQNIEETVVTDSRMNHTEVTPGGVPNKAAYLFWNDTQGTTKEEKSIGPAIALRVKAGDRLDVEAWSRFERKTDYTKDFNLIALSSLLGNTFVTSGGFDGMLLPSTVSNLEGALTSGLFGNDADDHSRPYAYVNYIIYDEDMVYQSSGWKRVADAAGFEPAEIGVPTKVPVRVSFDEPITIDENGYIYVWVSNQSKQTKVWFDDLRVKFTDNIVVQATDYGVWGDVMREEKLDESVYRFGYQGQFAEKDEETGWNHFEQREYDPVIGRWTAVDPKNQFYSPYIGMGNNPMVGVDADGGEVTDWVRKKSGEIYWDPKATSQATTKADETYLGRDLTFYFYSYIDGTLWDGLLGDFTAGPKVTSVIHLISYADENNNLQSVSIFSEDPIINATGGFFKTWDYYPGLANTSIGETNLKVGSVTYEQHARVNRFEEFGLDLVANSDVVNVAQQLKISVNGNFVSVSASTDIFPSAALFVNHVQLFHYAQPSFKATHGRKLESFVNYAPGSTVPVYGKSNRPAPSFYQRYNK